MTKSMFDLSGRVAVVSGAAQGMGQATAVAVAQHGADVALVDRNRERAEATAETIRTLGRKAIVTDTNVSDPDDIAELFRHVDAEFGRVDFLGNIAGDGHLAKPEDLSMEDLHRVLQNLVVGRFAMCQQAGRRMLAQGRGSIMNIGSLASSTALGRGHIAYSMAMGAVLQMTRELSTEWSHRGVRVNCVTPAQVTNPSLIARMEQDHGLESQFLSGIPAGRMGTPRDIMGLAVLLASDASEWITGAIIPMDGGNMAMNAGGTPGHRGGVVQSFRAESGEVRAMTGNDAHRVSELAIRSKSHWGYTDEQMAVFRDELTMTSEELGSRIAFGIANDAGLIGYYTVRNDGTGSAELEHLFVDPDHLQQGLGTKLLQHATSQCKALGIQQIVILSDPNAAGFYERSGACLVKHVPSSIPGRTIPQFQIDLSST